MNPPVAAAVFAPHASVAMSIPQDRYGYAGRAHPLWLHGSNVLSE
jgi:hypothetical protein